MPAAGLEGVVHPDVLEVEAGWLEGLEVHVEVELPIRDAGNPLLAEDRLLLGDGDETLDRIGGPRRIEIDPGRHRELLSRVHPLRDVGDEDLVRRPVKLEGLPGDARSEGHAGPGDSLAAVEATIVAVTRPPVHQGRQGTLRNGPEEVRERTGSAAQSARRLADLLEEHLERGGKQRSDLLAKGLEKPIDGAQDARRLRLDVLIEVCAVDVLRLHPGQGRRISGLVGVVDQEKIPLVVGEGAIVRHADLHGDVFVEIIFGVAVDIPAPVGLCEIVGDGALLLIQKLDGHEDVRGRGAPARHDRGPPVAGDDGAAVHRIDLAEPEVVGEGVIELLERVRHLQPHPGVQAGNKLCEGGLDGRGKGRVVRCLERALIGEADGLRRQRSCLALGSVGLPQGEHALDVGPTGQGLVLEAGPRIEGLEEGGDALGGCVGWSTEHPEGGFGFEGKHRFVPTGRGDEGEQQRGQKEYPGGSHFELLA